MDAGRVGAAPAGGACPVCGAAGRAVHLTDAADARLDIMACAACGVMSLREPLPPAVAEEFYQEEYYREEDGTRFPRPMESAVRWFRGRRATAVARLIPAGGAVLDVGCGRGLILARLRDAGCQVAGTQLSRTAAASIRRKFGIEVFVGELADAGFEAESFDAVLLLHVLEHMFDPLAALRTIRGLLKPGGALLVEVPNAGCPAAVRYGLDWLHWDVPHHNFHFDRRGLESIAARAGLRVESVRTFSLEYGPFGVMQAWLNRLLPGGRHFLYRRLSGVERGRTGLFLVHAAVGALLVPFAVVASAWAAARGNGDVLTSVLRRV